MISIDGLTVEFGVKPLFKDVSFVINERDRIALVGKNGAGKSTMLKILCGLQKPTSGAVSVPNDLTIGYLPQVMKLSDDTTVKEETRKAFADKTKMEEKLKKMEQEMAERTDYESDSYAELVERFTTEHERYMMMGGENYEAEIERTLTGLGFTRDDFDRPTREFSGGWRMRIELAKILLRRPDVLLLDEPTNHLDIESIQWLEQFLAQSAKAVVLVSHDRAFVNNVTNRTLEITCGHVEDYRVKYDEYLVLRKERREQQLRAYENQQKEIADTKAFIERFRYQATKAVQVQQRIRQLEKIVPIEVDEVDNSAMRLKFPPCLRSGDYPIIAEGLGKTYPNRLHSDGPGQTVFEGVDLIIKRGEKVAFVGKNGEGKSTFVKCIMGEIPFDGTLKIGHNVQIGYFAQNQAQLLDENLTIYETIDRVATGDMRLRINDLLGAFMFGGETSEKYVKVLSGGERSRLAMIKLLLEPVNLLILDEPTNHLDIASKEVLKEAIKAFDGTAIIVSHDREFLDGLVSKVYEFGGGKVKEHLGGIYDWLKSPLQLPPAPSSSPERGRAPIRTLEDKQGDHYKSSANRAPLLSEGAGEASSLSEASGESLSYAERKEIQKKIRKAQRAVEESESKIAKLEARKKELDDLLMTPENASNMELVTEYTSLQRELDEENERWLILSEELETLRL
ncbi:dynamin family / ABC transporter, ATP-binding multi-domain protein [Prevotella sp. oral taxon 306 str. F0472]|uniref:ABC-F family ATP-binding cassette domain-containing protein n=1 Tax=Prevotella sp. oral taxon 306 TaxID=712461 RepID=UPI00025BBBBF|nr:ABC-F family ATP-binding cassette domain-containing protein [Prevotella sp. oral taxon 306]EID32339.1 dynamin family / ABC transporter, ATP-binding multi-domain protein [Prevotella sp. oral taxon 306 str. F0472]